jgi:hypothetical protein
VGVLKRVHSIDAVAGPLGISELGILVTVAENDEVEIDKWIQQEKRYGKREWVRCGNSYNPLKILVVESIRVCINLAI